MPSAEKEAPIRGSSIKKDEVIALRKHCNSFGFEA